MMLTPAVLYRNLEVNNNILKDTHLIIENKINHTNDIKTDNLDESVKPCNAQQQSSTKIRQ